MDQHHVAGACKRLSLCSRHLGANHGSCGSREQRGRYRASVNHLTCPLSNPGAHEANGNQECACPLPRDEIEFNQRNMFRPQTPVSPGLTTYSVGRIFAVQAAASMWLEPF